MAAARKTTERKTKPSPTINGQVLVPEKWTWQEAEAALAKNNSNRHLRDTRVQQYARAMTEKQWGSADAKQGYRAGPAFICFDWNGYLLDGQHRLHAQVASKTTQYWYVLRDVPPSTQHQIDTGITRTAGDALKFEGYQNYIILASVARWGWLLEMGMSGSKKIKVSSDEILDVVRQHPDLEHSAEMGAYSRSGYFQQAIMPSPMGAAHWWIAQHNDHAEADLFVDRFVHSHREVDGSAILALMQAFDSAKKNQKYIQPRVQIAMIVKAWNLDVERKFVKTISSKTRSGEFQLPEVLKREVSQEYAFGPIGEEELEDEEEAG